MAEHKKLSQAETGVGTAALGTGLGIRPVAFGHYHAKRSGLEARKAAAQNYLTQGGKAKRDPTKVNLNTTKKKAALREINEVGRELKRLKPPTTVNRSKVWVPLTAGGAALAWHGGRQQFEKRAKREDFDAAAAGAIGGATVHQGVGLGYTLKRMKLMDAHTGDEKKVVREYNKTALPKGGMQTGDPRWKGYWRNYPKEVKGGQIARTLSRTHGGKSGMATLAGTAALGGTAAVAGRRKIEKRNLSQTQIDRKKRVGAELTRATSAIGLGSLALVGAGAAAPKLVKAGKLTRIAPKLTQEGAMAFRDKTKNKALTAGIVSSGIGGYNGFNNAAWQSAESRQRKKPVVSKSAPSPFEDGFYGSEGSREEITKGLGDWKTIDQRERAQRQNRKSMRFAGGAAGTGAGLMALGYHDKDRTAYKVTGSTLKRINEGRKAGEWANKDALKAGAKVVGMGAQELSATGKTGLGLVGAGAVIGGSAKAKHTWHQHKINQRRRANMSKSATSAFGVVHD